MPQEIGYLIKGYQNFKRKYFDKNNELFKQLMHGQKPKVLVVACSDSRVDPSIILDCKPGDLFVVRNIANLVPPCEDKSSYHGTSAALEFAVCKLGIRHIILLGHSKCGGITSLFDSSIPEDEQSFISKWIELIEPAKVKTLNEQRICSLDEQINRCAKYSLINSIENLETFPWVKERVIEKKLFLHGWYFNIETGTIEAYDKTSNHFSELDDSSLIKFSVAC